VNDREPVSSASLRARVVGFVSLLRALGIRTGVDGSVTAWKALTTLELTRAEDFFLVLRALLVSDRSQLAIFNLAFAAFWGERLPVDADTGHEHQQPQATDLDPVVEMAHRVHLDEQESDTDESLTQGLQASALEVLRDKDFERMDDDELAMAKLLISQMRLPHIDLVTRRFQSHPGGNVIDMRATLRASLRSGSGVVPLMFRRRRTRPPALVIICDISGSMDRYSRMVLHYVHALCTDRDRVHAFVFGTRLTNITREARERDVDQALARVSDSVLDWQGGTRIGHCIGEFNRRWSRRLFGQGAMVLFISDGLDRDAGVGLSQEMDRLYRSCRYLLWLNPLLRYEKFEPRSLGMQAIIKHVDELRSVHNLASLESLNDDLSGVCRRYSRTLSAVAR